MLNALKLAVLAVSTLFFAAVSVAQVAVTISSPGNGATISSSATVYASARGTYTITGWYVYLDNSAAWHTAGPTSSIAAPISMAAGTHQIHVRAWQSNGAYGDAFATVTVGSSTSTSTTTTTSSTSSSSTTTSSNSAGLPAVPSTAKVWSKIEETTDSWSSCSNCAGGVLTSNYWTAPYQTSPSQDGSSREFFNGGAPWANVLWIKKFGNQDQAKHFLWDYWVNFDSTTAANVWAAEYDLWQSVGGQEFMLGSQCNFGTGYWDTWNSSTGHWIQTAVPCHRFAGNTWHHIQWYMERISSNQYRYDTLVVDGVAHTLNQVFYTHGVNWADSLGIQWQLDLGGNGYAAHEWVDQVKLSIW